MTDPTGSKVVHRIMPWNSKTSALVIAGLGSVIAGGSLLIYPLLFGDSSRVAISDLGKAEALAYTTVGVLFLGLLLAFGGLTKYLRNVESPVDSSNAVSRALSRVSVVVAYRRSTIAFVVAALAYGLFLSIFSSTLVIQPGSDFSSAYGVSVPSSVAVVCCGSFGQMPQLVVYVTNQLAILVIPLNLILLFAVSWLVGLNAAIATYSYANRPEMARAKWMGGLGAFISLFTICPTCAGFFLLSLMGLGGAVGLALTLSSLQTIFLAVGIPILILSPVLISRQIPSFQECPVDFRARR